jgi:hypothetical protein
VKRFVNELDEGAGGETNASATLSYNKTEMPPGINRQANYQAIWEAVEKEGITPTYTLNCLHLSTEEESWGHFRRKSN